MNDYRKRQAARKGPASILQDLVEEENNDRPPHVILIEQLFTFIGSNPEKAVSTKKYRLSSATSTIALFKSPFFESIQSPD